MYASLLALITLCLTAAVYALGSATLVSTVTSDGGTPLAGVTVSLDGNGIHRTAISAKDGAFAFVDVPPGTYNLSFKVAAYAPRVMRAVVLAEGVQRLAAIVMHPSLTSLRVIGSVVSRERVPFNNTPAALKVFPREAYRDQGQASLATVLNQTPGATIARSSGDVSAQPMSPYYGTVRGGLPWETATLIDGNPVSLPSTGTFDLAYVPSFVLQDVEIVKGYGAAETTVFGAEDGALNLRTAEPGTALKGLFEIEGDDRGGQFSDLAYGGSSKDGRFSFTTMLAVDGNPGPDPSLGAAGAALQRAELLKARYQVSSNSQLTATYLGSQGTLGVAVARGFENGPLFASFANGIGATETHRLGLYSLELHSDFAFDHLTAKAYALQAQRTGSFDPFVIPAIGSGVDAQDNVYGFSVQDDHQISSSLYQLQLTHQHGNDYIAPLAPQTMSHDSTMVRAAAKLRAGNATDVQIAGAWLHSGSRRTFDIPVLHAGAAFHLRPNVTARVAAGSGATAPSDVMLGVNQTLPLLQTPVGIAPRFVQQSVDQALSAETSFGYDAGVEYRLHGDTTTLSADVYHTLVHGAFYDRATSAGALWQFAWLNAPPMTHEGIELGLQQFKRIGLGYIVQGSLVRTYVNGLNGDANLSGASLLAANPAQIAPMRVPYAQGYGEISYKWPRGSRASLGMLYFGANNPYARPAFAQLNANLELSLNDYSKLQFSVQNLGGVYQNALPVLVNAATPSILGTVGPRTVRFMFRQSIGGSLFER